MLCRDPEELYGYVTGRIGSMEAVRQVEIAPVLRRLKQAGTVMSGHRLGETIVAPRRASTGR